MSQGPALSIFVKPGRSAGHRQPAGGRGGVAGRIMKALVFNAGSSSLEFSLFEAGPERLLVEGGIDRGTRETRLAVRSEGHPETGKELTLRGHADAAAQLIEELRGAPLGLLRQPVEVRAKGTTGIHSDDDASEDQRKELP